MWTTQLEEECLCRNHSSFHGGSRRERHSVSFCKQLGSDKMCRSVLLCSFTPKQVQNQRCEEREEFLTSFTVCWFKPVSVSWRTKQHLSGECHRGATLHERATWNNEGLDSRAHGEQRFRREKQSKKPDRIRHLPCVKSCQKATFQTKQRGPFGEIDVFQPVRRRDGRQRPANHSIQLGSPLTHKRNGFGNC